MGGHSCSVRLAGRGLKDTEAMLFFVILAIATLNPCSSELANAIEPEDVENYIQEVDDVSSYFDEDNFMSKRSSSPLDYEYEPSEDSIQQVQNGQ